MAKQENEIVALPAARWHFHQVEMAGGQMALYSMVRAEALRQLVLTVNSDDVSKDYVNSCHAVVRLLQVSTNPILALARIDIDLALFDEIINEGPPRKMQAVADHARQLARTGQKVVIWTIFTSTIFDLERMLADLNPVTLYGAVPAGESNDLSTREGRLLRFHKDAACQVMIANPAVASEGISLHVACHTAIYLDRSYVSTHYLQSIDRIHPLGLALGIETNIHIYQTKAPAGLGSIDLSVSRRLATKLRNPQQLLDDPDLHQVALGEENADDPFDYDVEMQDLADLVEELEGRTPIDKESGT